MVHSCPVVSVFGVPKPKGSLRHVGGGRLVEQVNSAPWRAAIVQAYRRSPYWRGMPKLREPLSVSLFFTVPKPATATKKKQALPITRSSGDIDKLARLVLDAITEAGAIHDDSVVVDLKVSKRFSEGVDTPPGVIIKIMSVDVP